MSKTTMVYTLWRYGSKIAEGSAEYIAELEGCKPPTVKSRAKHADPFPDGALVTARVTEAAEEPRAAPKAKTSEARAAPEARTTETRAEEPRADPDKETTHISLYRPTVYRLFRAGVEVDRGTTEDLEEWYDVAPVEVRTAAKTGELLLDLYKVVPTDVRYIPEWGQAGPVRPAPPGYTSWRERHPGEDVPVTPQNRSGRARAL